MSKELEAKTPRQLALIVVDALYGEAGQSEGIEAVFELLERVARENAGLAASMKAERD